MRILLAKSWTYTCFVSPVKHVCFIVGQQLDDGSYEEVDNYGGPSQAGFWGVKPWFEFRGHLDEFIEVLFLVYCIRCGASMLEPLSGDLDEPDYRFDHDFYLSFEDIYYSMYRS